MPGSPYLHLIQIASDLKYCLAGFNDSSQLASFRLRHAELLKKKFIQDKGSCHLGVAHAHLLGRLSALHLLSEWSSDEITIENSTSPHNLGAPQIANSSLQNGYLSISHKDLVAVSTFHPKKKIGIDIEKIEAKKTRFQSEILTPTELELVKTESQAWWLPIFFWSAKEALLKAEGVGLRQDPKDISCEVTGSHTSVEESLKSKVKVEFQSSSYQIYFHKIEHEAQPYIISLACQN